MWYENVNLKLKYLHFSDSFGVEVPESMFGGISKGVWWD